MKTPASNLQQRYGRTLRRYLASREEAVLAQAYEVGRRAIARGWGVFDMARVHHESLEELLRSQPGLETSVRTLKAAGAFFLEAMSPFEAAHRGFRETNSRLHELISTLEERNLQLAGINKKLEVEIGERERTELALRQSEEHLRALFYQARVMQDNLRHLSNQILHAQEEERKRIIRELHDEVGQALTAISVSLATLKNVGPGNPALFAEKIADVQQLLTGTMECVHRFARELRPSILDELGLLPALRSCLMAFSERTGLQVSFRADPAAETLGGDPKTVLFRIAQESLTNVAKHAKATRVDLSLRRLRQGICMEVADNGRSFREADRNGKAGSAPKRLGLLGMQERVRLVNGEFGVRAEPGKGTTVRVLIPFDGTEAEVTVVPQNGEAVIRNQKQRASGRTPGKTNRKNQPTLRSRNYGQ